VTSEPQRQSPLRKPIARGDEEFARVLAFSDGLFAIAMTLLVVGIAVPERSKLDYGLIWINMIYLAFVPPHSPCSSGSAASRFSYSC